MSRFTASSTRASLVQGIHDDAGDSWQQFVGLYSPLILAYLTRRGLQNADGDDVTQEVLMAVRKAIVRFDYDPARSFRGWLFQIAYSKLCSFLEGERRHPNATGDTATRQLLDDRSDHNRVDEYERLWNLEYDRWMFKRCEPEVKARCEKATWDAFRLTVFDGYSNSEAAQKLSITPGAVALAKYRVKAWFKELYHAEAEHDGG